MNAHSSSDTFVCILHVRTPPSFVFRTRARPRARTRGRVPHTYTLARCAGVYTIWKGILFGLKRGA